MVEWYRLPARTSEQIAARHKARDEWDQTHAQPVKPPVGVRGGLRDATGRYHPIESEVERKLVHLLASADHAPIDRGLLRVERIGEHTFYVGKSGRHFHTFDITPRTAVLALDHAEAEEYKEFCWSNHANHHVDRSPEESACRKAEERRTPVE